MKLFIILFLALGISLSVISQEIDPKTFIRIADSLVVETSSNEFLKFIDKEDKFFQRQYLNYNHSDFDSSKIDDTSYTNQFLEDVFIVSYKDINVKNEYISIRNDSSSYIARNISVQFDSTNKVIKVSDFHSLERAKNRILNATILSRKEVEVISEKLFTLDIKSNDPLVRKSHFLVEYDLNKNLIYWNACRIKTGNDERKDVQETILINAESGDIISQETEEIVIYIR